MPVEVMNAFEAKFRVEIYEGYGLSETSPVACFNMPGPPAHARLDRLPGVGRGDGDPRREGPAGRRRRARRDLHPRPQRDEGLSRPPDATREALRGGWFHSGDVGIRDANGSYRIVDRVKDMIIRGGFNVYPREIEEVLYAHPAIVEAAVIGVPHESHGEEVKAVVVSRDRSCAPTT
jgi:long-chain acyl-CoA synthetase